MHLKETVFLKEYKMIHFKPLVFLVFILTAAVHSQDLIDQVSPPWGYVFYDWEGPPVDVIVEKIELDPFTGV